MKNNLLLISLLCLSCVMSVRGQIVGFDAIVESPGSLEQVLGENWANIDSLVVHGTVNKVDFDVMYKCISEGKVSVLNLEHAQMKDNKIPDAALLLSHDNWLSIRRVMLPDNIEEIGELAFSQTRIDTINIPASLKRMGDSAFAFTRWGMSSITLPEGLKDVYINCFRNAYGLERVVLPSTVDTIHSLAFHHSTVQEVNIPEGCDSIGFMAFCLSDMRRVSIPKGCTRLGNNSFSTCYNLQEMHIASEVTEIPEWFAYLCQNLQQLTLPQTLVKINEKAFFYCTALRYVELPQRLEYLGEETFAACAFDSIVFPASMRYIGLNCFDECIGVKKIYSLATIPPTCDSGGVGFESMDSQIPVYIPMGTIESYRNAEGWKYFINFIETTQFPGAVKGVEVNKVSSRVYWENGNLAIEIETPISRPVQYSVYTLDGKLISKGTMTDPIVNLPIHRNTYIVRVEDEIHKII